ncbi:hypothetical protein C0Q70_02133 [Pomacea canaliculata]|uniref:Uncharacterized protein n=1 Tax=Pomacea canaliculata TaxID=400727 RepID=A0A2T7Q1E4_POMCA|nr:hypothetical protein C0Q70_02133 [Pomacea canaliculata]
MLCDEIGLMSSNNTKLQDLTYKLTTNANAYEKQSSTDKSIEVMVNTTGSAKGWSLLEKCPVPKALTLPQ